MEDTQRNILARTTLAYVVMLIFSIIIIAKVGRIQFVEAGEILPSEDDSTNVRYRTIHANRGSIYSADGKLMATSVPVFEIRLDLANPSVTDEVFYKALDSLAQGFADLFGDRNFHEYRSLLQKGRQAKNRYMLIKRKVSYEELTVIRTMPILRLGRNKGGLIAEPMEIREMPYRQLAYRTIGWDKEGRDLDVGLEGAYSQELSGQDGIQLIKKLPNGIWQPVTTEYLADPIDGMDLHTTIDMYIQDIASHALLKQLQASGAHHGCVVVMEVATGHVKAIANLQRSTSDSTYTERYNHALGESYEPGSTFKLATVLAALEDGLVSLNDTVDVGSGVAILAGMEMKDASSNTRGRMTLQRAFELSSNVGISKSIIKAYGKNQDKFTTTLKKMGFGEKLGLEIAGEGRSVLKTPSDPSWSRTTLPWMAIGYEMTITPLQLLTFYNAIANNGVMVKPQFVTHVSRTGETVKSNPSTVLRSQIASPENIRQMQELMVRVVDHGTATNIRSDVYKIAGKTGTAKIASGKGGYSDSKYIASFAGYFPADRPRYSCIVMINQPVGLYYGGHIAAPVFKAIADKVYAVYLDMHHDASFAFRPFTFPNAGAGMKEEKHFLLKSFGINTADSSSGEWITTTGATESVIFTDRKVEDALLPDFRGMNLRDAIYLIEQKNLKFKFKGIGRVVRQSPEPGTPLKPGSSVWLELTR